jgi:hypothetical protein
VVQDFTDRNDQAKGSAEPSSSNPKTRHDNEQTGTSGELREVTTKELDLKLQESEFIGDSEDFSAKRANAEIGIENEQLESAMSSDFHPRELDLDLLDNENSDSFIEIKVQDIDSAHEGRKVSFASKKFQMGGTLSKVTGKTLVI